MFNFKNDYNFICHENILNALIKYQDEVNDVYGLDSHSKNAKDLIKKHLKNENVDIHFIVGGTLVNKTVINHILRPYEAVICADTGHINVHETGAIESTGHKVLTVQNHNGKIRVNEIENCIKMHIDEHMVLPRIVYISESTETGTVYTKEELKELYNYCHMNNLYLFVDGARLGVALATNLISLEDLAKYCDVFYIGGAKNGAFLGEAVVIVNDLLKDNFRFSIKQSGGMYSKGFVAGIQFEELFIDDLFINLGKNANECTRYLYDELVKRGFTMQQECVTNQIFPIVSNEVYEKLKKIVSFELWEDLGNTKVIRLVCGFKTKKEEIIAFIHQLDSILS